MNKQLAFAKACASHSAYRGKAGCDFAIIRKAE